MSGRNLLDVRQVSKSFPGVRALERVDLSLAEGEVLALIGENGAGKSTLMKILAGIEAPEGGELLVDGRPVSLASPRAATSLGIALIHQELNLADNLDAGANIFLGREPRRLGLIDQGAISEASRSVLARVGADFSPDTRVSDLPIGRQQLVEIAKALAFDARILIMDEPTSSLSRAEGEHLLGLVRDLRARGVGIIFISHRLEEVASLADRVIVLRDGRNAGELSGAEINHDAMVRLMVGREIATARGGRPAATGEPALEVENLEVAQGRGRRLSFGVRAGEKVGLAGLVGSGRTELLEALFGIRPTLAGSVRVGGVALRGWSPRHAIDAGLALVPEDRKRDGLFMEMSVRENVTLGRLAADSTAGFLDSRRERLLASELVERLGIRATSIEQTVETLSGGNQQKAVLARWFAMEPRVLLLDEPTRGVDIGARQEIYSLIDDLAGRGVGVLFASSDLEEVLNLADRTLVMHEGAIAGELAREDASEEALMQLATGARESAGR